MAALATPNALAANRDENILDNILMAVGNTPCVRLNKLPALMGLECEVVAKCEFLNPGGSVKDRIGTRMVVAADKDGRIKKGDMLIEPTSGNTGIGMSMAAAVLGYKMLITMPLKMSAEKRSVMTRLGADIIRTRNSAAFDDEDSHISIANRIAAESEHNHVLDQYANCNNPDAHEFGTGEEIMRQCGGKVDMLVAGAGTGGTITGIAKAIKKINPDCIVVGVDPYGSILAHPLADHKEELAKPHPMYQVEGIGYDFMPKVFDQGIVDEWVKCDDKVAFGLARQCIAEEGMLVGGSCGAALQGVKEAAKKLKKGQRCVVILPDNIRNYLFKFCDDAWMVENGLLDVEVDHKSQEATKKHCEDLEKENAELKAQLEALKCGPTETQA